MELPAADPRNPGSLEGRVVKTPSLFPEHAGGHWTRGGGHSAPKGPAAPDHWRDEEQRAQAERVGGAIGDAVLAFARQRLAAGGQFRMEELRAHLGDAHAPDSAGRILRLLRQQGVLGYELVSRRDSLYRVTRVGGAA